jgi:TP901 family phage tail tape measure protein
MAKDIKQVIDFDVSRGGAALNSLVAKLQEYNLTLDQISGATGSKFNKAGKAQIVTIEAQIDATKKLEVAMKLNKNTWVSQATAIKSNTDLLAKMRAETERYIAISKNLKNAGVNTGLAHGPGFMSSDAAQKALAEFEDAQKRKNRLIAIYNKAGIVMDLEKSNERLKIMEAEVRAFMESRRKELAIEKEFQATQRSINNVGRAIQFTNPRARYVPSTGLSPEQAANELKVLQTVARTSTAARNKAQQEALQGLAETGRRFLELTGLMKTSNDQLTNFMVNLQTISRVVWFSVLYSQMYRLIFAFREGIHNAVEFERRLAEIQTITQQSARTTDFWATSIRKLSDEMGNPVLDTAEGVYEAISNQIVQGGENTQFFREEMKLALITVSSFEDAVNSTSSIINSFGMSANDAAEINAVLFKTVDLGRVRLNEMANSIGRVSVLSDQLGISFIEQQAALAVLTQSGLKFNVAQTFYGNILQKLIRPSERMTEIFKEWGVTSGEAAIKTFGWVGVMQMLEREAQKGGDEMSEIGEIFQRIRAVTGFTVLNQEKMNAAISEMKSSAGEANKAFELINENIGQKMRVELNKIKNLFTVDFGRKLLETVVLSTEKFGGLANVVKTVVNITVTAARMYVTFRVNLLAVNAVMLAYEIAQRRAMIATALNTVRTQGLAHAMQVAKIEAASLNAVIGNFAALGLTLLIEAFVQAHYANRRFQESLEDAGEKVKTESEKWTSFAVEGFIRGLKRREDAFNAAMSHELQLLRGVMTILRKENDALAVDLEESFKLFAKEMDIIIKPVLQSIDQAIKTSEKRIDSLKAKADKINDIRERMAKSSEDADLERRLAAEKDEAGKINLIWQQAASERAAALALVQKDDIANAEKRIKRAEQLEEKALDRIEKLRNEKLSERAEDKIEKAEERAQKKLQQLQIDMQRAQEFAQRRSRNGRGGAVSRSDVMEFERRRQAVIDELNASVRLTGTKEDIEKKAADAAETRKKIEEDIVRQNELYRQQVEAADKRRLEALEKEQKLLKENQDFELHVKKELEDVTKFDPKKNETPKDILKRFDKEANEALDLIFDPRLTEEKFAEIQKKIEERRLEIIKESERLIGQEKLASAQKQIKELEELLKESLQKQKDSAANIDNAILSITPETEKAAEKIKQLLSKGEVDILRDDAVGKQVRERGEKEKEQILLLIEKLSALKKATDDAMQAGNTELVVKNFEKYKALLAEIINKEALFEQNLKNNFGVDTKGGASGAFLNTNGVRNTDKNGKLNFGGQNIDQIFGDLQQKMSAFTTASAEFNQAQKSILETNQQIIILTRQAVGALPAEYRASAQAALDAAKIQEEANKSVAASLQLIIDKLYEVIKLNDDLKHNRIGINGGNPQGFAFGGRGADTMMSLIRPGETVVNPQSSRIFEPVLAAIQRTRTTNSTKSSSIVNIGDITINGVADGNAAFDQFFSRVKRAKRRGQL